ncbi:MAG TPA: pilus assembly protein TadG-related protein [Allosphingosinicella sp.]|jgi:Flp pilus assembly protein TadG
MRALSWLRTLFSSERGNVLVVGAASMPLLIGAAAIAIDTIQVSVWKRQLQRAADSSAIAGAYALSLGDDEHDAIHRDLDKNEFPTLTQEEAIAVGARLGFNQTVRVTLTATRTAPFMSIFTTAPQTLVADATAALVSTGTYCMVSLYDGTDAGIDANGGAEVNLTCGMKANCTGTDCVTAGGNSWIKAFPIASVGGLKGSSNNFIAPTKLQPYSAAQVDPFLYLPEPAPDPAECAANGTLTETTDFTELGPDPCFLAVDVNPSDNFKIPDTVQSVTVYGGNIDFKGDLIANGITFIMTGPDGKAGDLIINSQANLTMSSPDSGTYKGVLFYRDRRASNIEIKINGGATSKLTGALYFPSSDISFGGNAGMNVECLQMVGQKLKFRGGATVTNTCPANSGASAFQTTEVRLVG